MKNSGSSHIDKTFRAVVTAIIAIFMASLSGASALAQDFTESDALATKRFLAERAAMASVHESAKDPETGLSAEVRDPDISTSELDYRLVPLTKEELENLAKEWQKIVRVKTEEVMAAQIATIKLGDELGEAAREKLTELTTARRSLFDKYSRVINALEKKGGNADLVAEYRAYRSAIIVEETRTADYRTLIAQAQAWMLDRTGGIQVAIDAGIIVVSLTGLLFVASLARRLARHWFSRIPNLSKLLQAFLLGVIYWLVIAFGLMIVLSALGIDISPAFALIGGASFILAFAFQDTLGNLASGMMIMINRPFDQGDFIDVGGTAGTVRSVSVVATTVTTPDNQVIVIPNKNVWGNVIINVTASDTRRVDLVFGISYEDSIPDALAVIDRTVREHPLVLDDPEPNIRVHELADSSVNFICRPWAKTTDYWTVYWDLTRAVKERFDEAGISIPYPQRDIHVHHSHAQDATAPSSRKDLGSTSSGRKAKLTGGPEKAASKAKAMAAGEGDDDRA